MVSLNPFSHEFHDDPFPIYRELRDTAPCYRNDELGFWALSRYQDVLDGLHDADLYCSRYGITLEEGNPLPMLLTMDPPDHTQLRRLVSRAFTPRRVADLEPEIRALAGRYLDRAREHSAGDFIRDYAACLPMDVISQMLGVPPADRDELREWSDDLLHREAGRPEVTPAGVDAAYRLYKYFCALVVDKRAAEKRPADKRGPDKRGTDDDFTDALLRAEIEGERLTDEQVVGFCFLLIIAGNETTNKLLSNCMLALQRFPDEKQKLLDDRQRIPDAVEEILRYESSTQYMARTLTRDVVRGDAHMHEGDKVLLLLGSANRDERAFADPDRFDIDRDTRTQHVGFGHGIHVCLGAALARMEMRVSLEEILGRYPGYAIDEAGLERVHSGNVRGYARMPIAW